MHRLSPLDRLLLFAIALLLAVIAAQGAFPAVQAARAQDAAATAAAPGSGIAAFPTDNQGRFVVVDGANRRMMLCEVVWTGPDAALVVRKAADF